jgi:hypothetical protein
MATLTCIKEQGLMSYQGHFEWGDSLGVIYFDGKIHAVGQARRAIYPSNSHYVFDLNGNVLYNISAPFAARGEANVSTLGGKLTALGGAGNVQDIWQFDPSTGYNAGSWTQIDADFTSKIGRRDFAASATVNGWFYMIGGTNNNTVYKTQNFTSWTLVGNLPSNITRLCACAFFVFQGKIWVIGGGANVTNSDAAATGGLYNSDLNGYVYNLNPATDTWTLVSQDKELFGSIWIDGAANSTAMYISKGYISTAQLATFPSGSGARFQNNRGLLRSTDGVNWTSMSLISGNAFFHESHRRGFLNVGEDIYSVAGFAANDMWKISE